MKAQGKFFEKRGRRALPWNLRELLTAHGTELDFAIKMGLVKMKGKKDGENKREDNLAARTVTSHEQEEKAGNKGKAMKKFQGGWRAFSKKNNNDE